MTERTHDVALCASAIDELEAWIEAARHGDRDALGRALSSVRDYLLLVANERLEPALKAKGNASDLVQETSCSLSAALRSFGDAPRANGGTGCAAS